MKIHFIAIGGSAMHNMALAMHQMGHEVSGSDDQIFEPSRTRLANKGLLPEEMGWFPEKISTDLDAIILGMHARPNNPELLKAQEIGVKIFSYPEYLYEASKEKKRVVIGGSHGKTSTTAMIMHVLKTLEYDFDYMVGAQLEGFDTMVRLSDAPVIILEGDEYLSSPIDRRPKFHWYRPHVAVLTGIAWDHINVFPTFEGYVDQFDQFIALIEEEGSLYYCGKDEVLAGRAEEKATRVGVGATAYSEHPHVVREGQTFLFFEEKEIPLQIFGDHNMQNLQAAFHVCLELGINEEEFYAAIQSFGGAARRLETLKKGDNWTVFRDFAHSPSKLSATAQAVKKQFDDRQLYAMMELHTFSSLNKEFLSEYKGCMDAPDHAVVFFDPEAVAHKKLPELDKNLVYEAFGRSDLQVLTSQNELKEWLGNTQWENANLLIMSSGNLGGIDVKMIGPEE